ncbi:MAG: hypothetical protein OEW42_00125 [Acidimicrobiia bacterium]|nr:hypothetical protein [Acidimicrobiia bacterium]MDH5236123.1 hypothetical protein [Acidimicrobiia bacterium]
MQRWHADEPDRPWVRRRYRDQNERTRRDDPEVVDLTDEAMAAREVNGRDFAILKLFRSRR